MFPLKHLSADAIPAALEKALRYRVLNEPEQAESICLDILAEQPHHPVALTTLILALTDQFGTEHADLIRRTRELLPKLPTEYERNYFAGIIWERLAIAKLRSGLAGVGSAVYHGFHEAMLCYEKAEPLRPAGNDDALLRWNSCARMIARHPEVKPESGASEVVADLGE